MSTLDLPKEFKHEHTQKLNPGLEEEMKIKSIYDSPTYRASGKLEDKVAIVTGGNSGIGYFYNKIQGLFHFYMQKKVVM